MKSEYKSRMETSTEMLIQVYQTLKYAWKEEIKTDGVSFNYDSQDIYKDSLSQIISHNLNQFIDKINCSENSLLGVLTWHINQVIRLYEKNKRFFENLNREWLILRSFRKIFVPKELSDLSDGSLKPFLEVYKTNSDRGDYFNSDFFRKIGFLEIDFHREIYVNSKMLLKYLKEKDIEIKTNGQSLLYYNTEPIFSLLLIGQLYPLVNDEVIEPISEFDFFKEINYIHTIANMKIKKGKKNYFYYLLHLLSETLNRQAKEFWLQNVFKDFDLKESRYTSKYRYVLSDDAGREAKSFAESLDPIFKSKNE